MDKLTSACLRSFRLIRWGFLAGALLVAVWACVSHPLVQPLPAPGQESDAQVTIVPMRHLDLLFMVDNSPSMKPKQDKMKKQFPALIEALRDRVDGSLPDLRVAILDSDVGAGLSSTACASHRNGDLGQFQMRDATGCGAQADARWLEQTKGQPINFTGDLSKVFGCLASNLGVEGCGFEHQLSVFEWAFYAKENASQWDFLRPEAYLGVVILTDEDDCSAPPDTSMFNDRVAAEAWSLRCATRGHQCDSTTLTYPTTGAVSVPYSSCRARMDASCDDSKVDTSVATACNPLVPITDLAGAIKNLKGGGSAAEEKVLVAAIYGRQRDGDTTTPVYKIDLVPDPNPNPDADPNAKVWDYWPICYDPAYPPSASGWDQAAMEHGAWGGLRLDAFLAEFPEKNRRAYSICEQDFGPAMQGIGEALENLMGDLCVPYKLTDRSDEPGLQADCRVAYRIPRSVEANGKTVVEYEEKDVLPACDASRTPPCWEVILGKADGSALEKQAAQACPAKGNAPSQMVNVVRAKGDGLPDGTKAVMQCLTCIDPIPNLKPTKGCDY